jgi:hypothetical protein
MKRSCSVLLAFFLTVSLAWANGGGYRTGIDFTGSVAPFAPEGVENIRIVQENLDIELQVGKAAVTVLYLMKNDTDAKVKVRFGFPVEDTKDWDAEGITDNGSAKKKGKKAPAYCQNYRVQDGNAVVKAEYMEEPVAKGLVQAFDGMEQFEGIIGWMVSSVEFKAGEEKQIRITYDSQYDAQGMSISDDSMEEAQSFRYRLSTGGVWKGPIQSGTVRVIPKGVALDELRIAAPANRFKKAADGSWVWSFQDLEPTLADDIDIKTTLPRHEYWDYAGEQSGSGSIAYRKTGETWSWLHQNYRVNSTSYLEEEGGKQYPARNVKNNDYDYEKPDDGFAAWVEGKDDDGIGEGLNFEFNAPAAMKGIRIRPGFAKDERLFEANNRPKTLTITLNGEHSFDVALKDNDDYQEFPVTGYQKPVKTATLRIKEVYRGKKYRDTAITDVAFETRLAKAPKVQGAR